MELGWLVFIVSRCIMVFLVGFVISLVVFVTYSSGV